MRRKGRGEEKEKGTKEEENTDIESQDPNLRKRIELRKGMEGSSYWLVTVPTKPSLLGHWRRF